MSKRSEPMQKTKIEKLAHENVIFATCDFCGKLMYGRSTKFHVRGVILKGQFGYGSKYDGHNCELCVCDECFGRRFKKKATLKPYTLII